MKTSELTLSFLRRIEAAAVWEARQHPPNVSAIVGGWLASSPASCPFRVGFRGDSKEEAVKAYDAGLPTWYLIGNHPDYTDPKWWPEDWAIPPSDDLREWMDHWMTENSELPHTRSRPKPILRQHRTEPRDPANAQFVQTHLSEDLRGRRGLKCDICGRPLIDHGISESCWRKLLADD